MSVGNLQLHPTNKWVSMQLNVIYWSGQTYTAVQW